LGLVTHTLEKDNGRWLKKRIVAEIVTVKYASRNIMHYQARAHYIKHSDRSTQKHFLLPLILLGALCGMRNSCTGMRKDYKKIKRKKVLQKMIAKVKNKMIIMIGR
jgi:hypothetical protein